MTIDKDNEKVLKSEYPGNSNKSRVKTEKKVVDRPKIDKIISTKAVKKKQSFGKRLVKTFVGEDIDNVGSYVIHDILVPAAKNTFSDLVTGGIEMLLYGEVKHNRKRNNGKSYVSYNSSSTNSSKSSRNDARRASPRNRSVHDFDDVTIESRGEAEDVLSHLVDFTMDYGMATVSDLYDLVGITPDFTDNNFGWTNLSTASVQRARGGGYIINFPRTVELEGR